MLKGILRVMLAVMWAGAVPVPVSMGAAEPPEAVATWMTDWDAARQQAAQEGKAVLMDFTGSDWCYYCIQLRKDVLDRPEFARYAADKFVLLEVDLPNRAIDPGLRARNEALSKRYGVSGFPTVLVVTAEGQVLGGFGGGGMGMDVVKEYLDAAYANLPKMKAASSLTGKARAKALWEVYASLGGDVRPCAAADKQGILNAAPDAASLFAREEEAARQMDRFATAWGAVGPDPRRRISLVEEQVALAMPENKSALLSMQSRLMSYAAETQEDILAAKAKMLEAAEHAPGKPEAARLREMAAKRFADPAACLRQIKQARARTGK